MKYDKAFNEKNAAALASFFTEDALLVAPEGLFSGRGAIEKRYADVFRRSHLSDFFGMRNQLNAIGNELCAVGEWWALLAVARSLPSPQGAIVEWREGDAGALPFAEALFDVAFCQLGLQYFPDRSQALREMHRVLKSSGRLVALVWRALVHSPGFAALAKALERHVSPAARAVMQAPFVFGDATEELRTLLLEAGFHTERIRSDVRMVRFASPEAFVRHQVAGSPLASHVAQVDEAARRALV